MILCADPKAQYEALANEIQPAIRAVLESGRYINGPQVTAFEAAFAAYIGCNNGVGVANGTDAIELALRAFDIGPGDEVITVSHTANATVSAVERAGAIPVLVDIDPKTFTIDPAELEKACTAKTKAVVAVHLYGHSADLDALLRICKAKGIKLIEDCAQAHGAEWNGKKLGSFGDIACFSFYPTKNLGAIGDGGIVVTNDGKIAEKLLQLREYGWKDKYCSSIKGVNSRLDEIQAAILAVKLNHLDGMNEARRSIAKKYDEALASLPIKRPYTASNCKHVFHLYVIQSPRREELKKHLADQGIHTLVHYPIPIHLQPAYLGRVRVQGELPVTKSIAGEILSLPMYPELKDAQIAKVCEAVRSFQWKA